MKKLINSIDKRDLIKHVNLKINRSIPSIHVYSVVSILIDELLQDLKNNKDIEIFNFGKIYFSVKEPFRIFDYVNKKHTLTKRYKYLKFKIAKELRDKIIEYLDVSKI